MRRHRARRTSRKFTQRTRPDFSYAGGFFDKPQEWPRNLSTWKLRFCEGESIKHLTYACRIDTGSPERLMKRLLHLLLPLLLMVILQSPVCLQFILEVRKTRTSTSSSNPRSRPSREIWMWSMSLLMADLTSSVPNRSPSIREL